MESFSMRMYQRPEGRAIGPFRRPLEALCGVQDLEQPEALSSRNFFTLVAHGSSERHAGGEKVPPLIAPRWCLLLLLFL